MKSKILYFLAIFMIISINARAETAQDQHSQVPEAREFTTFRWGESKGGVMSVRGHAYITVLTELECNKKIKCIEKMKYYQTLSNGLTSEVSYFFRDDRLVMGTIEVIHKHIAPETALLDFDVMQRYISYSRGEPIFNTTEWLSEGTDFVLPLAVARGDAVKYAEWEDDYNFVTLMAYGVNGKVKVFAEFYSATESDTDELCLLMVWSPKRHDCRPSILLKE